MHCVVSDVSCLVSILLSSMLLVQFLFKDIFMLVYLGYIYNIQRCRQLLKSGGSIYHSQLVISSY